MFTSAESRLELYVNKNLIEIAEWSQERQHARSIVLLNLIFLSHISKTLSSGYFYLYMFIISHVVSSALLVPGSHQQVTF